MPCKLPVSGLLNKYTSNNLRFDSFQSADSDQLIVGCVEIPSQVFPSAISDVVISSLWSAHKAVVFELDQPFVDGGSIAIDIVRHDGGRERDIGLIEQLQDLVVYRHLHPTRPTSSSPHAIGSDPTDNVVGGVKFPIGYFIGHCLLVSRNIYSIGFAMVSLTADIGSIGLGNGPGRRNHRRPGVGRADRPCQTTQARTLKTRSVTADETFTTALIATLASLPSEATAHTTTVRVRADAVSEDSMSCEVCGARCVGARCADCEMMQSLEAQFACIECGNPAAPGHDLCLDCEDQEVAS